VSNSLPTYFLLLSLVLPADTNKDLEWPLRVLSAVTGALSVPVFAAVVFYWLRNRTAAVSSDDQPQHPRTQFGLRTNVATALLAGLLLAVDPLHIWYSQEARAYALMLFFGLLAVLFLELEFASRRSEWFTLYLLASVTAVVLHRSALVFPGLCCAWHAVRLVRERQRDFKQLLVHVPIAVVALLLTFIKLNPPPEGYRHAGSVLQFGYTFMTYLGGYSFGPSLIEIQNLGPFGAVARNWFQVAVLLLVLAPIGWVCGLNWRKLVFSKEFALLAAGTGFAAGYALVSSFAYNVRYVLPGLFGFLALLATLVVNDPQRPRLVRGTIAAVLVVSLWADGQWFYSARYRKPDARAVAKWLVANKEHVKSWMLLPDYLRAPVQYYLLDGGKEMTDQSLTSTGQVGVSFPPVPDVLMLQRRDQLDHPEKTIEAYRQAAGSIQTNYSFAGFEIYVRNWTNAVRIQ